MKKYFLVVLLTFVCATIQAQADANLEPVSNKEEIASPKVKVFPNPATRVINILGVLNTAAAQITISDMYGKIVVSHEWEIRKNAINIPIANLEPGIYMITILSKEQQVKTKFYKQ